MAARLAHAQPSGCRPRIRALRDWESPGADDLVVLTFDDGYADTFNSAYPMMLEREFRLRCM